MYNDTSHAGQEWQVSSHSDIKFIETLTGWIVKNPLALKRHCFASGTVENMWREKIGGETSEGE